MKPKKRKQVFENIKEEMEGEPHDIKEIP